MGDMVSYADDTTLYFSSNSCNDVKITTERGIALVKDWFDSLELSLNLSKITCLVLFKAQIVQNIKESSLIAV